ncbi:MAG: protein kinase [Candidatus Saganbacteria bacterium]|nr:protein kinase [Candidatus Saganbacteria bacterium]
MSARINLLPQIWVTSQRGVVAHATHADVILRRVAAKIANRGDDIRDKLTGRYRLIIKLGSGARSEVWMVARDKRLGRGMGMDALKFSENTPACHRTLGGVEESGVIFIPEWQRRYGQEWHEFCEREWRPQLSIEARFLAFLNEAKVKGVPHYRGYGRVGLKEEYLAMDVIGGSPLKKMLQDKQEHGQAFSLAAALNIVEQVARTLQQAKLAGDRLGRVVVNADVKPHNIVVTEDGIAILLDWGLGALIWDLIPRGEGIIRGSPAYLAPESCKGKMQTYKADIFSLGVVLWEMVEGEHPLVDCGSVGEILKTIVEDDFPRCTRVPMADGLIQQMVCKDPTQRIDYPALFEQINVVRWNAGIRQTGGPRY